MTYETPEDRQHGVDDYCQFIGLITGVPVSQHIADRFALKNESGYFPCWSHDEIERLHLLAITVKNHTRADAK